MIVGLRKAIKAYLITLHPRVYFKRAPFRKTYPYIVVDFQPSFTPDEGRTQLLIDIDGWDKPGDEDTTALEELMEKINGDGDLQNPTGLDRQTLTNDDILAMFRIESIDPLDDDDPAIRRRKYTYQTTVFERRI